MEPIEKLLVRLFRLKDYCIDQSTMLQVEKLKIFLASPSDAPTERRYVVEVVEEVNRLVAGDRGVVLEVVRSEKNVFPGYGTDGQDILNKQIANMQEYELFIGIMWNRIGTKTPRARSGTVEEFGRAVSTLRRKGKPQVWFYFRQAAAHLTTKEELQQRAEVLEFRSKFQRGKGLFWDYTTPADFRNQLRGQLNLWLNQRKKKTAQPRAAEKKQGNNVSGEAIKSRSSPVARDRKKPASGTTTKTAMAKTNTATRPSTASRKALASKSSAARSPRAVRSPEAWVMLDGKFFQAQLSNTQPDRSIILQIPPKDMEQAAELKALHPGEFHNRKQLAYADLHEAGIMQISSVTTESLAGKPSFSIILNPIQRSQNSGFAMEANFNNHSADEIAELRARLILLGEALPRDLGRFFTTQFDGPHNRPVAIEEGIFPELWAKLQTQPELFLPRAWLWAAYYLKMCQVVEDVLELQLGPVKNKVMPVRFRGRRKRVYANQESSIINVEGSCTLSA